MAIIVEDTFTEASNTALTAHTPAPTGTSWTQLLLTLTAVQQVYSATGDVGGSAASTSGGQLCKSAPDPTVVEYDIDYVLSAVDTGTTTRPVGVFARISDASATNYYRTRHLPTGNASADTEIMKMVGTTKTSLGTVDTGLVANDAFTFQCRDAAKTLLKNGSQILTSSDNTITGAGSAGMGMGTIKTGDTGNLNTVFRVTSYKVTTVEAGHPWPPFVLFPSLLDLALTDSI